MTQPTIVINKNERAQWPLLAAVFGATFVVLLDTSIVVLAVPAIRAGLGITLAGVQWVLDGFTLVLCAGVLGGGVLGDRLGTLRTFAGGIAVFTAGSLLCAVAGSLGALLAGRAVQGAAACLVIPGSLALLARLYPDTARRAKMMGWWGLSASLALALGPVAGGALTERFGWPSIFLVNVPFGAAIILLCVVGSRDYVEQRTARHLDPLTQLLAFGWIGALTYAVITAGRAGIGDASVVIALAIFLVLLGFFLLAERIKRQPMIPLELFANRSYVVAVLAAFGQGFAANSPFFVLSLYLQQTRRLGALSAGLQFLPYVLTIGIFSVIVGRLINRFGARLMLVTGYMAVGCALLGLLGADADTSVLTLSCWFVLLGAGNGLSITPVNILALSAAPPSAAGAAAGTANVARQFGITLGIAVLGAIVAAGHTFLTGLHTGLLVAALLSLLIAVTVALNLRGHRHE